MTSASKRASAYLAAFNRAQDEITTKTFDVEYARLLGQMKALQAQSDLEVQITLCDS